MRYYIIAGERSGDLHAGNLAKAIRHYDDNAVMRGFGGAYMESAGVEIAVNYSNLAFMGFWEVVKNLRTINQYLIRCKEDILAFRPDVVVLVDYGGFNKKIAAWAKKNSIRTFYYISPKVWAWNEKRALKLKASVDRMFVILPFEKDFYKKFDWEVDYVGNPVLDAVKAHSVDSEFHSKYAIDPSKKLIALLPGSRKQELLGTMDLFVSVAQAFPEYQFAVAKVNTLAPELYSAIENLKNVKIVTEDTYNLLSHSTAAIVTSGTATLETALLRVPQIVVYKTSLVTYWIVKMIITVPYISLVNLIAGRQLIRELIQNDLNLSNVSAELRDIVEGTKRSLVLEGYDEIWTKLDTGSASDNAGRLMVNYLINK